MQDTLFPKNWADLRSNAHLKQAKIKYAEYDEEYVVTGHIKKRSNLIEKLWTKYKKYADPGFNKKIKRDFHPHTWEMYLTVSFLENGVNVVAKNSNTSPNVAQKGPDCKLIINDQTIWVEATVSKEGEKELPGKYNYNGPIDEHDDPRIIRITNSLEKKLNKYKDSYLKSGVRPTDPFIIALNTSEADANHERQFLKTSYGLGNLRIHMMSDGSTQQSYECIDSINKIQKNNDIANIDVSVFNLDRFKVVSGILFCPNHIINAPLDNKGSDFFFLHNYNASNPIPLGTFKFGVERWIQDGKIMGKDWNKS